MTTICKTCGSVMKPATNGYVCPKCDNFYLKYAPTSITFEKVAWTEEELRELIKKVANEILEDK